MIINSLKETEFASHNSQKEKPCKERLQYCLDKRLALKDLAVLLGNCQPWFLLEFHYRVLWQPLQAQASNKYFQGCNKATSAKNVEARTLSDGFGKISNIFSEVYVEHGSCWVKLEESLKTYSI